MIDRSYTLVTGPVGSGKTSLIEALVGSNRSKWLAAIRVEEVAGLAEPTVDEGGNDETRRWKAAGDVDATLLRVPAGWRGDAISVAEAVGGLLFAADAIVIEGNVAFRPRELDAAVFVAPAGGPLLVEERREVGRIDGQTALSLALGLNPADADDDDEELPYGLNVGDVIDEDDETVVEVERIELPDEVAQAIRKLLEEGRPISQHKRWFRTGLDDLWKADLVVVGTKGAGGAEAGRLREEILAVRRDEALRREVTGGVYDWPRTCIVADLRDRSDEGTRKVVQTVKRRWRRT